MGLLYAVEGGEASDWPTFQYDVTRAGYTSTSGPDRNFTLWTYKAGNHVSSSPAVVAGRIYFSTYDLSYEDNATILCLNASTGALLWNYTEGHTMWSPTVAGNRVYMCGGYEWYSTLFCFDAITGTLLWRYNLDWFGSEAAPAVASGRVYFGDRDDWFYCLDADTGTLLWRYRTGGALRFSSPAVAEGRVYVGSWDDQLYCLDALNGILHWTFKTGGIIDSSPAVVGDKVYIGSADANVYCLDAATGTQIWNCTMDDIVHSSPAVAHGRVYVGSRDANVYCLNATTGTNIWRYETDGPIYGSPSVTGNRVYVGSYDRRIYCLDAATGRVIWIYKTGDYVFSSAAITDGRVYIGSLDNRLYAFGSNTNIFPVEFNETTHYIEVISNSEISGFSFDHPSKTLTFTASGPLDAQAFANITLSRTFLREPFTMRVDGSPGTPVQTSNTTHVSLFIDYVGDLHIIEIIGADSTPSLRVEPLTISFPRSYPIDYPALMNHTTLTNDGNETITIETIKLTLNEANVYRIEAIYLEGFAGALLPVTTPFSLSAGRSAYIRISWSPIEVEGYSGILEIVSDDPVNTIVEVSLYGAGTTASGVNTITVEARLLPGEEVSFRVPIDIWASITKVDVAHAHSVSTYATSLTNQNRGVILDGRLVHPDLPGQIILEISSTEGPRIYDVIIDPHLVDPETLPDLVVTDIWHDGAKFNYQVLNQGGGNAPSGSIAHLYIDGMHLGSEIMSTPLGPGERFYGEFHHTWSILGCPEGSWVIAVSTDATEIIPESEEGNNKREEIWKCDQDPPRFLKEPMVDVGETSATITWETNEQSDSVVTYDDRKPVRSTTVENPALVTSHTIIIEKLEPATVYAFFVESTDASGNTVRSDTQTFFTQSRPDSTLPRFDALERAKVGGIQVVRANVTDDVGVRLVQFYLDGRLVGVDYSYPFEIPLDPDDLYVGEHDLDAEALDYYGNSAHASTDLLVEGTTSDNPLIVVRNPREGDTISGTCQVGVIATDPDGMDTLEIYLGTDRIYSVSGIPSTIIDFEGLIHFTPTKSGRLAEESLNITYPMDTLNWDNGPYAMRVRGWDVHGNTTEWVLNISIFNAVPRRHPNLLVTKPPAELIERPGGSSSAGLVVVLGVENTGEAPAINITIEDVLHGFFPTGSFKTTPRLETTFEIVFNPSSSATRAIIGIPELGPGESVTIKYAVVPALREDPSYSYRIGEEVHIEYNGTQGDVYSETVSITVGIVEVVMDNPPMHLLPGGFIALSSPVRTDALDACLITSDYLIVTCPSNMWTLPGSVEEETHLIQSMAQLAWMKKGTIGFLNSAPEDEMRTNLCELIWDGGHWGDRMAPGYSSDGYLLIVGETDIVPSFDHGPFNVNWEDPDNDRNVDHCDTDYGDPNGNWNPDIIVGRIIGETASALQIPIQTSINVTEGWVDFDAGFALLIAGYGENAGTFETDVADLSGTLFSLDDRYDVTTVYMQDFFELESYDLDFSRRDRLMVGDVMGDGFDEIMIVRTDDDVIDIYQGDTWMMASSFSSGEDYHFRYAENRHPSYGQIAFIVPGQDRIWTIWMDRSDRGFTSITPVSGYFDFATGDLDGDPHIYREYVVASSEDDTIQISRGITFDFDFTQNDKIAVGNVMGDDREEIIIARDDDNSIFIYDNTGTLLETITDPDWTYFSPNDRLVTGNVCRDDYHEILVAMDDDGIIYAYNTTGHMVGSVDLGFTRFDHLCAGNVMGDDYAEVIIARDDDGRIVIGDMEWPNRIRDEIQASSRSRDLIVFRGHGNVDNWNVFRTWDVPADFGSAAPFVLALTCLAGNYEEGAIAERFLERGAGAYIGSTQISPTTTNSWAVDEFFDQWCDTDLTLGEAFKELESEVRRRFTGILNGNFGNFWVAEYNFYGDPKYGSIDHPPALSQPADAGSINPPKDITITIPQLEFTPYQNYTWVSLPGGGYTMQSGTPQLPTHTTTIPIPSGWQVKNIELMGKSGKQVWEDIDIIPTMVTNDTYKPPDISQNALYTFASGQPESLEINYPPIEWTWEVIEAGEEQRDLVINIVPATININTARLSFWNRYEFGAEYTPSPLLITELETDMPSYRDGDIVTVEVRLDPADQEHAQGIDVVLEGAIRSSHTGEVIHGLPLQTLTVKSPTYTTLAWEVERVEPGGYTAEILVLGDGGVLDAKTRRFWVRGPEANLTRITVKPPANDLVEVSLETTSEITADGEARIWIANVEGRKISDQVIYISAIPGQTTITKTSIPIHGMDAGEYLVVVSATLNNQYLGLRQSTLQIGEELWLNCLIWVMLTWLNGMQLTRRPKHHQ